MRDIRNSGCKFHASDKCREGIKQRKMTDKFKDALKNEGFQHRVLGWFFYAAALTLGVYSFLLVLNKWINPDEICHLNDAWHISAGYVPYLDFFEHHNPLLWYVLAPLFLFMKENTDVIFVSRFIMLFAAFLTAGYSALIARGMSKGGFAGTLVFIFLFANYLFLEKAVEVRPDGAQVLFGMISFYCFLSSYEGQKARNLLLSAVFAAVAFMFLQKAVFLYAVYFVLLAARVYTKELELRHAVKFLAILLMPAVFLCLFYLPQGAAGDYFHNNFIHNVGFTKRLIDNPAFSQITQSFKEDFFLWLVIAASAVYIIRRRKQNSRPAIVLLAGGILFALSLASLSYRQYYMHALPFFAIAAAYCVSKLAAGEGAVKKIAAAFIVVLVMYIPVKKLVHFSESRNAEQVKFIRVMTAYSGKDDVVVDYRFRFNIFRRRTGFLGPLKSDGRFDLTEICGRIQRRKPAVVGEYKFDFSECGAFKNYRETQYEGFYVKRAEPKRTAE